MHSTTTKRSRATRAAGTQGFTIIETVIALFVAMVIGFGAISLFLFSVNYNSGASDRARALALAQQRMEGFRAKPYADLLTADTTEQVTIGSSANNEVDARTFSVRTKIESDAGVPNNRQRIITITVTPGNAGRWTGGPVTLKLLRASDKLGAN